MENSMTVSLVAKIVTRAWTRSISLSFSLFHSVSLMHSLSLVLPRSLSFFLCVFFLISLD